VADGYPSSESMDSVWIEVTLMVRSGTSYYVMCDVLTKLALRGESRHGLRVNQIQLFNVGLLLSSWSVDRWNIMAN